MNLILWRHAEAEDGGRDRPDEARQLTKKGLDQASRMAAWLNSRVADNAHVLVSPSVRTRQTADALGRPYEVEESLYASGVNDYMDAIRARRDHQTLVLVGHQPVLGELAALLLCGEAQPWSVEKGSVWWLALHGKTQDALELMAVMAPELL